MINVHASLLPAYRGAAPVHRAVIDGCRETGITIMRVVHELDAGPMFAAAVRAIGDDETSGEVEQSLAQIGAELLLEVVEQIAGGTAHEEPQDHAKATYAHKLTKSEGTIDWALPAARIHNLVRGLQPWPLVVGAPRRSTRTCCTALAEPVSVRTPPVAPSSRRPGMCWRSPPETAKCSGFSSCSRKGGG